MRLREAPNKRTPYTRAVTARLAALDDAQLVAWVDALIAHHLGGAPHPLAAPPEPRIPTGPVADIRAWMLARREHLAREARLAALARGVREVVVRDSKVRCSRTTASPTPRPAEPTTARAWLLWRLDAIAAANAAESGQAVVVLAA